MPDRPTARGNRYAGRAPSRPAPDRDPGAAGRVQPPSPTGSAGSDDSPESGAGRVVGALEALDSATIHRTIGALPKRELDVLRGLLRVPAMLLRESDNAARVV